METENWHIQERNGGSIRDVQEAIFVLVLFVDAAHQGGRRRDHLLDIDEDCLLRGELYALADDIDKLAHGEIGGDEVLLLVDGGDI